MKLLRIESLQQTPYDGKLTPAKAFGIGRTITAVTNNAQAMYKARRPFWDLNPFAPQSPTPAQR